MSTGAGIGTLVGAVLGFVIGTLLGSPLLGLYLGATVGYTVGNLVDPATPDIKQAGCPLQGLQFTPNEVGTPIPDVLGTAKIAGFLLIYGRERSEPTVSVSKGGKGGSKKVKQVTGHRYFMSWALGICKGPINTLYTIKSNEKVIWEGELNCPVSGGKETIVIEDFGSVTLYFGTDDQVADLGMGEVVTETVWSYLSMLTPGRLTTPPTEEVPDLSLNSPLRNLCWAFFDDCYIGNFNRMPTMFFVVRKAPVLAFSTKNEISVYDYNPAHSIWYILHELAGLPEAWLHSADFKAVAQVLFNESRGISMLLQQHQSVQTYIESINMHMDGILRYDSDGKFHPKLLRDDYDPETLPLVDESIVLEEPTIVRKSWIDTINEVKVQYSEIIPGLPFPDPFDSCYCWFKYNEGIGAALIDYSPLVINGDLTQAADKFWSIPGFGHNDPSSPLMWARGYNRPTRDTTYASMCGFIRPLGPDPGPWVLAGAAMWLGTGGTSNWMKVGWDQAADPKWHIQLANYGDKATIVPAELDTWHFIFIYADVVAKVAKFYVRKSGEDFTLVEDLVLPTSVHAEEQGVLAFGGNNTSYPMDGGDMIWWISSNPSIGCLTLEQADYVYEQLKGRHGMI